MPGSSLDLGALPSLDDVEFVERLGQGVGAGRFKARLGGGETVALLLEDPSSTDFAQWATALASLDHPGVPRMVRIEDALQPGFAALDYVDGSNLEARLAILGTGLSELDALSLVLQASAAIRAAHRVGVAHGELDPRSIVLVERPGGLDGVVVVGWSPPVGADDFDALARRDLTALGNLLYVALTGVEPPSRQRLDVDGLEGGGGAFDDILMDWVDVERDLGGLGRPALDALADSGRYADVAAFVDALLPHFRSKVESHLDQAAGALDADRAFMTEVERQRARLRELEARQRSLRDWLSAHAERIERCDVELDKLRDRVRALQTLETEMGLLAGHTGRPAARLPDRFVEFDPRRGAWSEPPPAISNTASAYAPEFDRRGLDRVARIDADTPRSTAPPLWPQQSDEAEPQPDPEPVHAAVEPPLEPVEPDIIEDERPARRRDALDDEAKSSGGSLVGAMGIAVVLGVLAAAWLLVNTDGGPAEPADPPAVNTSAVAPTVGARTPPPIKAEVAPIKAEVAPAKAEIAPEAPVEAIDPPTPEAPAVDPPAPDQPPAVAPDQPPSEGETFAPVDLNGPETPTADAAPQAPPPGMIAVPAGLVRPGLADAQRQILMDRCKKDLRDYPKRWCTRRLAAEIEPIVPTRPVAAVFADRFEVDQRAYKKCVSAGVCESLRLHWDLPEQPATGVTRDMAAAYCAWRGARLPTVDEWIYIARGDTDRIYPWGDEAPGKGRDARANFGRFTHKGGLPDRADRNKYAATIDAFGDRGEGPFGARQMSGNVREWTSTVVDGKGITLGGGWREAPFQLRVTRLEPAALGTARNDLGFRCVQDPERR